MDFFKELLKLYETMPKAAMFNLVNQNSPYGNYTDRCKNCYLLSNAFQNEDCYYGRDFHFNKNCVDCDHCHYNELLYESLDCRHCYNSSFLQDCENCTDCDFCFDCRGCRNCFGCAGLRQKEYCLFNEPLTKEQYFTEVKKWKAKNHSEIWEALEKVKEKVPHLYSHQINTENCFGDYIKNSKNVFYSYGVEESQDIFHSFEVFKSADCCDMSFGEYAELNYECFSAFKMKNSNFCTVCWESSELEYCAYVFRSHHCFGCVFLNHKEFNILNKPYEKEAWHKKVAEIKDQLKADRSYGRWAWPSTYPVEDTVAAWERL